MAREIRSSTSGSAGARARRGSASERSSATSGRRKCGPSCTSAPGRMPATWPTKSVGALAKDPTDDSVWIGYRDAGFGVSRIKPDGTVLHYLSLGDAQKNSPVWDIQVQPATATSKRRILVAFRRGSVGVYDGN